MFQLTTNRFILKPFQKEDAQDLFFLNNDLEVLKYTGNKPFKNEKEATDFIESYDQFETYKLGRFSVLEKSTNEFLGWCGLKYSIKEDEVDLGFRYFRKHWNKGYATESSLACLDYGFNQMKLKTIVGRAMKENTASIKVLEKLGMEFQKEFDFEGTSGVIYAISPQRFYQLHYSNDR